MARVRAAKTSGRIRVLVFDQREIVREGLRSLLTHCPQLSLVGHASTVDAAVQRAHDLRPDVAVMGVAAGDTQVIPACRDISGADRGTRVILVVPEAEADAVMHAIAAGAAGILLPHISSEALLEAVVSVARGESVLDPAVTSRVLGVLRTASGQPNLPSLSDQDRRILEQLGQGRSNKQIASAVGLSEKTVKHHVSNILHKLNVRSRSQAAAFAARHLYAS